MVTEECSLVELSSAVTCVSGDFQRMYCPRLAQQRDSSLTLGPQASPRWTMERYHDSARLRESAW